MVRQKDSIAEGAYTKPECVNEHLRTARRSVVNGWWERESELIIKVNKSA